MGINSITNRNISLIEILTRYSHAIDIDSTILFDNEYLYCDSSCKQTLEKTEWAIKSEQSRETGSIGYTKQKGKTKNKSKKHNTIYVGPHYAQRNTNNVNKT